MDAQNMDEQNMDEQNMDEQNMEENKALTQTNGVNMDLIETAITTAKPELQNNINNIGHSHNPLPINPELYENDDSQDYQSLIRREDDQIDQSQGTKIFQNPIILASIGFYYKNYG